MRIRTFTPLAAVTAAAVLCAPAAATQAPTAHRSLQCGSISTSNGGQARFLNTYRMSCSTARKIARKARGKTYKAIDGKYTCRPKRSAGISGLSYFCKNSGTTRSLGFIYRAP